MLSLAVIQICYCHGSIMPLHYQILARPVKGNPVNVVSVLEALDSNWVSSSLRHTFCYIAAYRWMVERGVHQSFPLVLQSFINVNCTIVLQIFNTLRSMCFHTG
jgi:hypothetical protein